jgi:parallel beta-helix repeat protein
VFELKGAGDIKLDDLNITGGQYGIYGSNSANSDNVTVLNSFVYGNGNRGISIDSGNEGFTLTNTQVYLNGGSGVWITAANATVNGGSFWRNNGWGVELYGASDKVSGADVYGNNSGGITASYSGGAAGQVVVDSNRVFDNNGDGINVSSNVTVSNNEVWGQVANRSGIAVSYGALAAGNTVWGNDGSGIYVYSATVQNNRTYGNHDYGVYSGGYATIVNNRVYGDGLGGVYLSGGDNLVRNNLIEANGGAGILVNGVYYSNINPRIDNNTIVATLSDGIVVQGSTRNLRIDNNIIDVTSGGYAIKVTQDSEQDFASDYNLFMLSNNSAVAYWENRTFANRTDWFYEVGFDQHSLTGDAQFVDLNGADNVIG